MELRRVGYLLVRVWVALVVVGAGLLVVWVLYPSVMQTPDFVGLWVGLLGFLGLTIGMLYLVENLRD